MSTYPAGLKADVILGAEIVYQDEGASLLLKTLQCLLKPGGTFLHVSPTDDRAGLEMFLRKLGALKAQGHTKEEEINPGEFELISAVDAPQEYVGNPLVSGSEVDFVTHFTDLQTKKYRMYEFQRQG
ncbi:unnamed protein product [Discosporangium mesarthrocarpum]